MEIISKANVTYDKVLQSINSLGADVLFLDETFPNIWLACEEYGINAVGGIALAAHETNWGKFTGKVKAAFRNPCGLKMLDDQRKMFPGITDGDNPLSHAIFPSWRLGSIAMAQHLKRYAGQPVFGLIVDPRFNLISPSSNCVHFADLGGKWAPRLDYGQTVERIAQQILDGIK